MMLNVNEGDRHHHALIERLEEEAQVQKFIRI